MPTSHTGEPSFHFQLWPHDQLPTTADARARDDASSNWLLVTHVGHLNWIPDDQVQPGPAPIFCGHLGSKTTDDRALSLNK